MLSEEQLATLYDCATTSTRLPNDFADDQEDLKNIIRYGELFKACHAINSTDFIQKSEDLKDEEKVALERIVEQKLAESAKNEKDIAWNVNIVVANSYVAKSLRPVINIQMPTVGGDTNFEFDIDSFAQFRQQLAQAVLAVNPQE